MENKTDLGKLILRVGLGTMMLSHGWAKLMKFLEGGQIEFPDPLGVGPMFSIILAIFAEFLCSALIIFGFKTRWVSIPLIITMLVAGFVIHAGDPWHKKELALIYAVGFLAISLLGAGKYSFDKD